MEYLNIETSQHVQINYPPAGIGDRVGAFIIDLVILGIYLVFSLQIIDDYTSGSTWIVIAFAVLPVSLYHLLMEVLFEGQSLGKKAVDIKVIQTNGRPARLSSYLLRWIFRLFEITMTSGTVAFFTILINGRGQRLGDLAAGTTVVKTKKATSLSDTIYTDIEEGYTPAYPEVQKLNDRDIAVVREVLNERNSYDSTTRLKILLKTRNALQRKMGIGQADIPDTLEFLQRVLKDYNYMHR